jgi:hypothetical protein
MWRVEPPEIADQRRWFDPEDLGLHELQAIPVVGRSGLPRRGQASRSVEGDEVDARGALVGKQHADQKDRDVE